MIDECISGLFILTTQNMNIPVIKIILGSMILIFFNTCTSAYKVDDENEPGLRYPTDMLKTLTATSSLRDH